MSFSLMLDKFLKKYFFILKAAAEGWAIIYIGNDIFVFQKQIKHCETLNVESFLSRYEQSFFYKY
jgi:hypothetical protein